MTAHIVLAHPEPRSFNATLAAASARTLAAAGWETTVSDLYAMGFDAREGPAHFRARANPDAFHAQTEQRFSANAGALAPEVADEIERLLSCDLLVVHFPLWWFGMPAILKGWMDRVFVYGRVYRSAMRYDAGICAGKKMIACVTTGADADACAHNGREGDTRLHLWPILYPFRYLGFSVYEAEVLHGIGGVGAAAESGALDAKAARWEAALASLSERPMIRYNRDDDFDARKRLRPDAPTHSPFIRQAPKATRE